MTIWTSVSVLLMKSTKSGMSSVNQTRSRSVINFVAMKLALIPATVATVSTSEMTQSLVKIWTSVNACRIINIETSLRISVTSWKSAHKVARIIMELIS